MNNKNDMKKTVSLDTTKKETMPKKKSALKALIFSKKAKRGALSVLLVVIFIAVVVGLNILTTMLTNRYSSLSVDFTANRAYKLTDESLQQISRINKDVTVYVLTDEAVFEGIGEHYVQINKLLHEFDKNSDSITLKYVVPASDPNFASKYSDINWYTSSYVLLVECGDQYVGVMEQDLFEYEQDETTGEYVISDQNLEQALLSAILNVMTEEKVNVTFLEVDTDIDPTYFMNTLSNNAFNVDTVSLLNDTIPQGSQFLVMFAPKTDITQDEYTTITKWLENDGEYGRSLVYIANPRDYASTPNIDLLLENWNMIISDGWVWEQDERYMSIDASTPQLTTFYTYESQEFTQKLATTSIPVVMSRCRPIEIIESGASPLLATSDSAVLLSFTAESASWDPSMQEAVRMYGAAISTHGNEDFTKKSNVIAIGSSDAFSDIAFTSSSVNNLDFFLNIFNTISARDDVALTIEGKNLYNDELGITSVSTANFLVVVVRYIIPIGVIIIGIAMWIYRRKKNG